MKEIKEEEGVVAEYNGKYWGVVYSDGQCTCSDFTDLIIATISNPKYCKKPTDMTYTNSPDTAKLSKAKLVRVKRTTIITIEIEKEA